MKFLPWSFLYYQNFIRELEILIFVNDNLWKLFIVSCNWSSRNNLLVWSSEKLHPLPIQVCRHFYEILWNADFTPSITYKRVFSNQKSFIWHYRNALSSVYALLDVNKMDNFTGHSSVHFTQKLDLLSIWGFRNHLR